MNSLLSRAAVAVCALALGLAAPTTASAKLHCASAHGQAKSKNGASEKSCAAQTRRAKRQKAADDLAARRIAAAGDTDPGTDITDPGTVITDPGNVITDPGTNLPDPGTGVPAPAPRLNPAQQCRAERAADPGFAARYGTNHNLANAFGKCVSGKAKAQGGDEGDEADEPADS